jgi:hypothetical protein
VLTYSTVWLRSGMGRREVRNVKKVIIFLVVKVKVQFTLQQATKAQGGSRGIALLFP